MVGPYGYLFAACFYKCLSINNVKSHIERIGVLFKKLPGFEAQVNNFGPRVGKHFEAIDVKGYLFGRFEGCLVHGVFFLNAHNAD